MQFPWVNRIVALIDFIDFHLRGINFDQFRQGQPRSEVRGGPGSIRAVTPLNPVREVVSSELVTGVRAGDGRMTGPDVS